jgi:hypothetical protein
MNREIDMNHFPGEQTEEQHPRKFKPREESIASNPLPYLSSASPAKVGARGACTTPETHPAHGIQAERKFFLLILIPWLIMHMERTCLLGRTATMFVPIMA